MGLKSILDYFDGAVVTCVAFLIVSIVILIVSAYLLDGCSSTDCKWFWGLMLAMGATLTLTFSYLTYVAASKAPVVRTSVLGMSLPTVEE